MKTVFQSSEIAHVWANEGAPYGRSSSNLSFEGDAISSYATVIGRRIKHKGKTAYVLDTASFSNSTSKSQCKVRSALRGGDMVFRVNGGWNRGAALGGMELNVTPAMIRDHFLSRANEVAAQPCARMAVKRAEMVLFQNALLNDALAVCHFFGLPVKAIQNRQAKMGAAIAEARAFMDAHEQGRNDRREIRAAKKEQRRAMLDAEKVPLWLAGDRSVYLSHSSPTLLRVSADGEQMETSKGARVPLADAERAYRFASLRRARGWHRNGETCQVGMYQLDRINEEGIIAGCHRVKWEEVDRFAALMGWTGGATQA